MTRDGSVFTEINPWTQPGAELPVFNAASAQVIGSLAVFKHCMIVAPRNTGKSILLEETASKLATTLKAPVRLLDAGQGVDSVETIEDSIEELALFSEHNGTDSFILVDNIGRYSTLAKDTENNKARLDAINFFANLLADPEASHVCVATRGLEPQIAPGTPNFIDLRTQFSEQQRFEFSGLIDRSTAVRLLRADFDNDEVHLLLNEIPAEELTYQRVRSEIERKASDKLEREFEPPLTADEAEARDIAHQQYRDMYPNR